MNKLTKSQKTLVNKVRNTKGRFFGLHTIQGDVFNAQFLGETSNYITIYDRNRGLNRRLAKTSLSKVNSK